MARSHELLLLRIACETRKKKDGGACGCASVRSSGRRWLRSVPVPYHICEYFRFYGRTAVPEHALVIGNIARATATPLTPAPNP